MLPCDVFQVQFAKTDKNYCWNGGMTIFKILHSFMMYSFCEKRVKYIFIFCF